MCCCGKLFFLPKALPSHLCGKSFGEHSGRMQLRRKRLSRARPRLCRRLPCRWQGWTLCAWVGLGAFVGKLQASTVWWPAGPWAREFIHWQLTCPPQCFPLSCRPTLQGKAHLHFPSTFPGPSDRPSIHMSAAGQEMELARLLPYLIFCVHRVVLNCVLHLRSSQMSLSWWQPIYQQF